MGSTSIYSALTHAIKTNSGIGFHNADQGHPFYVAGTDGGRVFSNDADSPETNSLYKMLHALSEDYGGTWGPRIDSWESFCTLAYESYKNPKMPRRSGV